MIKPKYSVIVPVFNRPDEVRELLESLARQTFNNFEVILVEDGSSVTSEKVFEEYSGKLNLRYFFKPNSGPGPSRNFGFEKASGDFLVIFDSDCILPRHYFEAVEMHLQQFPIDVWGGPDRGGENFTAVQQAMAFTMSSVLTTGGIRGKRSDGFQPRSFNMGMKKEVFEKTGGFKFDRLAEDIELSIRIHKAGFQTYLIPEAYVYHRRRTNFSQFLNQVAGFGKGRALVGKAHPGFVKVTHWFPAIFLAGLVLLPILLLFSSTWGTLVLAAYLVYLLAIGIFAWDETRSFEVALLAIPSAVVQLTGYGWGFLREVFRG